MHMNNKKIFLIYIKDYKTAARLSDPGTLIVGHPNLCKTWIIPHTVRSNEDT